MLRTISKSPIMSRLSATISNSSQKQAPFVNNAMFKREISIHPHNELEDHSFVIELRNNMPKEHLDVESPELKSIIN